MQYAIRISLLYRYRYNNRLYIIINNMVQFTIYTFKQPAFPSVDFFF